VAVREAVAGVLLGVLFVAVTLELPLAHLPGAVAGLAKPLGEGDLVAGQRPAAVLLQAEALLVAPRQHAGARGHALGALT